MPDIWEFVAAERAALADELDSLDAEAWEHPSACPGWRVRDVVGHLVFLAEGSYTKAIPAAWRDGLKIRVSRMMDITARKTAIADPAELTERLRAAKHGRFRLPGAPPAAVLAEVIVHGEDIRRPLSRPAPQRDPASLQSALDFYVSISRYFIRSGARGLKLIATDTDWSAGRGDEVRGPALDLLLALAGRSYGCDGMVGDGVDSLRARCPGSTP